MKAILTAVWAVALFVTALPASAAEPDFDTRTVKVDYSDLDLSSTRGVSRLENRVSGAISEVCGGPAFNLQESVQQRACRSAARAAASRDVNDAIATTRQLPSTDPARTPAHSVVGSSNSPSTVQPLNRHNLSPRH